MNTNLYINHIVFEDIDTIYKIESLNYQFPWSFEQIKNEINNNFSLNLKIINYNSIIGYCFSIMLCNELQINNFCIKSEFQNKGYGSFLLKHLILLAKNNGVQEAFLEVRKNNISAIKLYSKFNFRTQYIRNKFYSNGEDALVMSLKI